MYSGRYILWVWCIYKEFWVNNSSLQGCAESNLAMACSTRIRPLLVSIICRQKWRHSQHAVNSSRSLSSVPKVNEVLSKIEMLQAIYIVIVRSEMENWNEKSKKVFCKSRKTLNERPVTKVLEFRYRSLAKDPSRWWKQKRRSTFWCQRMRMTSKVWK